MYVEALAAPDTINTMPEKTLRAFAEHGRLGAALPADGGDAEAVLESSRQAGGEVGACGQLQQGGARVRQVMARCCSACREKLRTGGSGAAKHEG